MSRAGSTTVGMMDGVALALPPRKSFVWPESCFGGYSMLLPKKWEKTENLQFKPSDHSIHFSKIVFNYFNKLEKKCVCSFFMHQTVWISFWIAQSKCLFFNLVHSLTIQTYSNWLWVVLVQLLGRFLLTTLTRAAQEDERDTWQWIQRDGFVLDPWTPQSKTSVDLQFHDTSLISWNRPAWAGFNGPSALRSSENLWDQ